VKTASLIVATALAVGGGALSVWSASTPPTTNPSSPADSTLAPWSERRREGGGEFNRGGGPRSGQWSRDNDPTLGRAIRPEPQWGDVDWFMKRFTPTRWQKFLEMPESSRKDKLKTAVANRYRAIQELKINDTDTYSLRVRRLEIEDRIFDLGWRVNHNGEPPTSQPVATDNDRPASRPSYANLSREQMHAELRKEVRSLIANRIEERRLHVRQLNERLNSETARLNDEQANVDRLVEDGMSNIQKQRWPGMGAELVPPMPSGAAPQPQGRVRNVNAEEARQPANPAPTEASEQQ
jgi:hypothetical protein